MEKEKRVITKWIYWFTFAVAVIAVYKTLDNFSDITNWIKGLINTLYPFIMAAMMLVVLVIMIVKVLPMISQVYYSLGSEVPASVRIIMQSGRVVTVLAAIFLAVLIAAVIYSVVYSKIKKGKKALNYCAKTPIIKPLQL